jgi:hypothetical protein
MGYMGTEVSVLLTRLYVPSGDFADLLTRQEPAIGCLVRRRPDDDALDRKLDLETVEDRDVQLS